MTANHEVIPFDLDRLGKDVESTLTNRQMSAPHSKEYEDLGRLSADAVQSQYEMAAKAVEEMGHAIRKRMEDTLTDCDKTMKMIDEAAKAIRAKGEQVHKQIAEDSALSQEIHKTVENIKSKMGVK